MLRLRITLVLVLDPGMMLRFQRNQMQILRTNRWRRWRKDPPLDLAKGALFETLRR
jgi:hypothetical protein